MGSAGDIVDVYTVIPWPLLCEEIVKLKVNLSSPVPTADTGAVADADTQKHSGPRQEPEEGLDEGRLQRADSASQLTELTGTSRMIPAGIEPAFAT